ncbi:cytoplasmic dynein 1 light intermediate chain 2-like [Parasteatoda tepidariorum]|nr:cytoplasmic dynein 1 light intermediate chain 2-like [Parasteatoda tepidariorum]XP_015930090.2 cytoplasmic dynein 1 light intermediate chain 2-like [Parasteatoda tepidariorum]
MDSEATTSENAGLEKEFLIEDPGESFWLQLMAECQANAPNKLPSSKSVLVLGDDDAGKAQLIARLQGSGEKLRKGNGLEYHFLNVRDEYCENSTKLDIWMLDEDPCFQRLLKYVLNSDVISDTTVILTASMAKPWNIFYSICTWVQILDKHIASLNIPPDIMEEKRSKVLDRYRKYVEPTQSIYGSLEDQYSNEEIEHNLGLDIIVVITNNDYMTTLQTEFGYVDEHFDFMQLTLRKFCLSYGASLFYVSVKEDRNCDILLKYILHKVYGFPFRIPAMFLDRDSIFVPAGWDSENKILTLAESLATIAFSSPFEDVIIKPSRLCDEKRICTEVEAQTDQDFLHFLESSLRQPLEVPDPNNRDSSFSATSTQRNTSRRVSRSPGVRSPQKKLEAKLASGEGDTVLHTFFKSLLNRRTSAPVDRPIGMSGNRAYNPPLGSQKSSNISLDGGAFSYGNADVLAEGDKEFNNPVGKYKSSIEQESLPVVDELKDPMEMKAPELPDNADPFTEFIKRYKEHHASKAGETSNVAQSSLEEDGDEKDIQQLPEYFMSSQGSSFCPTDCCYQNKSSDLNDFVIDDACIDRVRSKFNPPLRLLLEKSYNTGPQASFTGGHDECIKRASSNPQNQNGTFFPTSSLVNGKAECSDDSARPIVPDLLKETMIAKKESKETPIIVKDS